MHIISKVFRGLALFILGALLSLLLSAFILTSTIKSTVLDRDSVKSWVATEQVFNVVKLYATDKLTTAEFSIDDQEQVGRLSNIVDKYFDVPFFVNAVEEAVDAFFDWSEGKSEELSFEVRIYEDETELKSFLSEALFAKLSAQPDCKGVSDSRDAIEDPFNAKCKPIGLTDKVLVQELHQLDLQEDEFQNVLDSATITSKSLGLEGSSPEMTELKNRLMTAKMIPSLIGLAVLFVIALVLIFYRDWVKWMRFVGIYLIGSTVVVLILSLAINKLINVESQIGEQISSNVGSINLSQAQSIIAPVISDINGTLTLISGLMLCVGVALILSSVFLKRHRSNKPSKPDLQEPTFAGKKH